jgi:oxygen-independent coproporphyrinogen-3 oxidase
MLAVYIHWPFCISKCPYCDFNSRVGDMSDQERWRISYAKELEYYAAKLPGRTISSVFFGGGTPSLMEARTVESVLTDISRLWSVQKDAEITLEANPSSVEAQKFKDFCAAGINRLSLGVQSLNDDALKFMGRAHTAAEARDAIALAAKHFPRYSFDLIYGYQGQTPEVWSRQLREALPLARDHLSLYQLTIEPRTAFYVRQTKGETLVAEDEVAAAMYEATQDITTGAGLTAYEISNHARAGQQSRHNLTYWHYDDYIGIGPGAHGRFVLDSTRYATENLDAPGAWLKQIAERGHGVKAEHELDEPTAMREAVMMGLRLTEGLDFDRWATKFSKPLCEFLPPSHVEKLREEGLVINDEKTLRATQAGLQRLNAILDYLLNCA